MNQLIFLVGASGAGKTTVAQTLASRAPWMGHTHYFDSIGVPSPEEMEREFGGGEGWQRWATGQWVERMAGGEDPLALLEGQTRPSFINDAGAAHPELEIQIILLDCTPEVRRHRLTELRESPELATDGMDLWAVYLVGQAHALGLPVIDTSDKGPDEIAREIEALVERDQLP